MIIALSIVGFVGAGMVIYLAVDAVKEAVDRVTTINVEEPPPPPPPPDEPPPPDQPDTSPPPPNAPAPIIDIPRDNPIQTTQQETPKEVYREPARVVEAPAGPPQKGPSKARGVQPKGQKQWAARIQENYPRRAQQEEIEGTVGVRVTVTPDGRATNCQVTASSGSSILDNAACTDLQRYGRFEPALDDDGNPISASWPTRITYKLN